MSLPLVSVITPTWQRHDLLLGRCIPSVQAQLYPNVEHVIVSDGPDPDLRVPKYPNIRYAELPAHDPGAMWGHWARLRGLELASGALIAYLDDDNAFRPQHLARLVGELEANPSAGFAYSRMVVHDRGPDYLVGAAPPCYGQIDTSIMLHRRELLDVATWEQSLPTIDWDLVDRWMRAGVGWAWLDECTVDYYG